ncbi:metallophosphoesterase [Moraxella nasovis]|uniref:metallophosphoesterase family protein n=1 Tax=Moraxella nasovis TaxID=2904121 RepID=UPI001F621C23|nr:metallophosphoesterase [Moraxella nasovis]UNU72696.1 metallophosphoesterase [Moraxella nasovis]
MKSPNPPYSLHTPCETFRIAQISDLHIQRSTDSANLSITQFEKALRHAVDSQPDLLLLTGDLINNGTCDDYDWLFSRLSSLGIAFVCIAGNHDVTIELNHHLPFYERTFLPKAADDRLLSCHKIDIHLKDAKWQLLLLNSAVSAQIHGALLADTLAWLHDVLSHSQINTVIALHHHAVPVESAWIDAHALTNADEFWALIKKHAHVKLVLCGHVHQARAKKAPTDHPCIQLSCPSTNRQFMPKADDFCLDDIAFGYRLIDLMADKFDSRIIRVID